jgi:hypothetical protein
MIFIINNEQIISIITSQSYFDFCFDERTIICMQ